MVEFDPGQTILEAAEANGVFIPTLCYMKATAPVEDGAPNRGRLCVKGHIRYDFIYSKDRLMTPLIKENGSFRDASWDEPSIFWLCAWLSIICNRMATG
jgi:predicted molibdopterin-dependent oxidoreductase YjgC